MFSEQDRVFLQEQFLARIATVSTDGQPTVDAVGFDFDGKRFYIGGSGSRKYKNVGAGNTKVSLIIDTVQWVAPWYRRGIKIHGIADFVEHNGYAGAGTYLAITPQVSWSWGIEDAAAFHEGKVGPRKIVWE
jgi:pyridoxamine 5'-phosphate oxidase family protein